MIVRRLLSRVYNRRGFVPCVMGAAAGHRAYLEPQYPEHGRQERCAWHALQCLKSSGTSSTKLCLKKTPLSMALPPAPRLWAAFLPMRHSRPCCQRVRHRQSHPGSGPLSLQCASKLSARRAGLPLFPLTSASSPSPVFQSAYEAVVPCGTASSLCCSGVGRLLAHNGTSFDGYSIAYNSAAFALFSMNASVRCRTLDIDPEPYP